MTPFGGFRDLPDDRRAFPASFLPSIEDGAFPLWPRLQWGLIEPMPGRAARGAGSGPDGIGRHRCG